METNELPEEVKRNIDEKVDIMWGYSLPEDLKKAAEFGYRLALQSKEEEINRISENFAALQVRLGDECTKSNALEEQLKAKDEENERLKELLKRCNVALIQFTNQEGVWITPDLSSLLKAIDAHSLLSQSTDKQRCVSKTCGDHTDHNVGEGRCESKSTDKP